MQFEATKEYIEELRTAIATANQPFLDEFREMHEVDIAAVLNQLELEEVNELIRPLETNKTADVLIELDEDFRKTFLASLSSKEIAERFIENLETDEGADVVSALPEEIREEVLSKIPDAEHASDIVDLLHYEEGTAGALMGKEMIVAHSDWTVLKCIEEIRAQAEDVEDFYTVYVINEKDFLQGTLSLKKLLISPSATKIADILYDKVIAAKATESSEEIANIMEKYDLVALPVVDELNRLIGRITIDDVVDVMKEEAEKDYQMASGHSVRVESSDKVWTLTRSRLPWLLVGLLGGIFGAQVIGMYEHQIQIYPEMAFFIPLIAAMGGNVGVQASSIVVQGLANKSIMPGNIATRLSKEFLVGLVNGLICAAILFGYNYIFSDSMDLSITVSVALVAVILFAATFGTITPLALDKYKIDPALATGPFITTMNDIFGLLVYFWIGHLMYA